MKLNNYIILTINDLDIRIIHCPSSNILTTSPAGVKSHEGLLKIVKRIDPLTLNIFDSQHFSGTFECVGIVYKKRDKKSVKKKVVRRGQLPEIQDGDWVILDREDNILEYHPDGRIIMKLAEKYDTDNIVITKALPHEKPYFSKIMGKKGDNSKGDNTNE